MRHFNYPIKLTKQKDGSLLITFPDLPEAITHAEKKEDVSTQALECLEEAIANRMKMRLSIPIASQPRKRQYHVSPSITLIAKVALYIEKRYQVITYTELAKKLNCDEKEVRRLLDPSYNSKLPRLEEALRLLGVCLEVTIQVVK